jgi:hypothetical protein
MERYKAALDAAKHRSSGEGNVYWKPREVTAIDDPGNIIHLVPIVGWPEPFLSMPEHRLSIAGLPYPRSFTCPRNVGLACPVCEILDKIGPRPRDAEEKEIKSLLYRSYAYQALIVDLEEPEAGVRLWKFKTPVWRNLMGLLLSPDWPDLCDLTKGPQIVVKRTGKGMKDTEYAVGARPVYGLGEGIDPAAVLEEAEKLNLAALLPVETYETLEGALDGRYDGDAAKALRQARDQAGKGPRRLGGIPDAWTEQELDSWLAEDAKARSGGSKAPSSAKAGPATIPPAQELQKALEAKAEAPDEIPWKGEGEASFEFGAQLVGRKITFDAGNGGPPVSAVLSAFTPGKGYDALDEKGETWELPDQDYFELVPVEPPPPPAPKPKPQPKPKATLQEAVPAPASKAPTAMSGAEVNEEAKKRLAALRGKK